MLDFLLRGFIVAPGDKLSFSRVGYVSPSTASLLIREPDPTQLPLIVSYQEEELDSSDQWIKEDIAYNADDTTDFTVPVILRNLKAATRYRYSLSNNMTGAFQTAPQPGTEAAGTVSFVTSSCMKPNFPYNPMNHPLRIKGIEQMSETLAKLPSDLQPSFMLFLGDFIYIDVPERFGSSKEHYRSEYRRIYSSPSWSFPPESPAINLPWIHTLDDHEIENDWSKGNLTPPFPAAIDPFVHYHVSVNPPIPSLPFAKPGETTYFSFVNGPASFFMLDTRGYRSDPNQANSTILGPAQLQSLLAYLAQPEPADVHWKIVSSSVPFTKNWRVGTADTWGGFLNERKTVLEAMWRAERELGIRVVLLSGDRHEFGATRFIDPSVELAPDEFSPYTAGRGIIEFSVGPLSMFYLLVHTYRQTDNEDVAVKYAPDGNNKFGLINIATENVDVGVENFEQQQGVDSGRRTTTLPSSVLTYSLYVDGTLAWKYRLSVPISPGSAAGETFPPGDVILDDVWKTEGIGAYFKTAIGRGEEIVAFLWQKVSPIYFRLLEKVRKYERVE